MPIGLIEGQGSSQKGHSTSEELAPLTFVDARRVARRALVEMPRILLVEDDPDVRMLMEHVLIAERYEVDAVATVASGYILLGRGRYNLVLTDGRLPDGSGIAVADEAARRGIHAIVVTAYAFQFPHRDLDRYELLLKPLRPAELLEAVRRAVGQPGGGSTSLTRRTITG